MVPGFFDMHTHAMFSDALPGRRPEQNFELMIANGITGFREMAGSKELIAQGSLLRKETDAGTVVAPELLILPGEVLAIFPGHPSSFFSGGGKDGASPAEIARREVLRQKEYGAEFIKIVNLNREAFFATQETAAQVGLHVAGHLNPIVSATEASKAGLKAMEHLGPFLGILVDCSTAEEIVRKNLTTPLASDSAPPSPPSREMIKRVVASPTIVSWSRQGAASGIEFTIDTYSEKKSRALGQVFSRNGTWQVPTLIRIRTMQTSNDPLFRIDPNLKYVAPETRAMWEELTEAYIQRAPEDLKTAYRRLYDRLLGLVKLLKEEGIKMLAGSDMTGIYCIPGFSLHQEFRELAKAGLSPLEILQMTTLNGAEFLSREATMGSVEEGKNADLVLLDGNPMESVENLEKIHAVFLKGRYFPKAELEKMKSDVEGFYKKGKN